MFDRKSLHELIAATIQSNDFRRGNFGGPRRGGPASDWRRVLIRRLESGLQFEYFDQRQSFARNPTSDELAAVIREVLELQFSAIHLAADAEEIDVRISKKGKVFIGRRAMESASMSETI